MKIVMENKNGMDWINTVVVNFLTPFFKNMITNIVQEQAANAMRTYLDEINHIISRSQSLVSEDYGKPISTNQNRMLIS